jgi:uncharacterized membrane protein YkoI
MKTFFLVGRVALAASAITFAGTGMASAKLKGAELMGEARFTLGAARIAALKVRPGKITDQELEKEKGGSGLRYTFDILSKGKSYEVGVDAKTGMILENVLEGRNPD